MSRLALLVCVLAVAACCAAVSVSAGDASMPTLLETAMGAGAGWVSTPRTRLEKLQLTQTASLPESLGANTNQVLFAGSDQRGHPEDTQGNIRENAGRVREPQSNVFGAALPSILPALPTITQAVRAPRAVCTGANCPAAQAAILAAAQAGPVVPAPAVVPPPAAPALPDRTATAVKPTHRKFPTPPAHELPLATPKQLGCGDMCNPDASDPLLARVPSPPLNDAAIAAIGLEGTVLAKVVAKLRNREGWLRAQKLWLGKAVESAGVIRREIDQAEFIKNAVASDLEQLQIAQDALSIKYKADRLKWSYKDKKITMEALKERLEALEHARSDVSAQIREAKDEVVILENTLGPPSQQVVITPNELEDPLGFLHDVIAEHESNDYTK